MTTTPEVSVVMSVYNDARYLKGAVDGVLAQEGVDFEFIVINDGSTDASTAILREYAAGDSRIRLVEQENTGLTRALIRGCALARAPYIARQDSDDYSVPGRLRKQKAMLDGDADVVIASSWAEVIGPEDEPLLVHRRPADVEEATRLAIHGRTGPPGHGSVMFRRDAYERAGGYRESFRYAQDSDLWLRMLESGKIAYAQEVLYRYRVSPSSVSGDRHHEKIAYAQLIDRIHTARLRGEEHPMDTVEPVTADSGGRSSAGMTLYFIGRQLLSQRDPRAVRYFAKCIQAEPTRWKAWILLLASLPMSLRKRPS